MSLIITDPILVLQVVGLDEVMSTLNPKNEMIFRLRKKEGMKGCNQQYNGNLVEFLVYLPLLGLLLILSSLYMFFL